MNLRNITPDDYREYKEMSHQFYHSDAVNHSIPDAYFDNTFDQALHKNPAMGLFMLIQGEETVGYALTAYTFSNEAGGDVLWIEELYIKPEFRGMGFGKQAIRQLMQMHPHAKRFRLEVTEENRSAIALYKALGFEELPYMQMLIDRE